MPTYITLMEFTREGIANVEEAPDRIDEGRDLVESLGGEVKAVYATMGRYDYVVVQELPNDEAYAKVALKTGQVGAVSTETLKAFPEDDYREILDDLAE